MTLLREVVVTSRFAVLSSVSVRSLSSPKLSAPVWKASVSVAVSPLRSSAVSNASLVSFSLSVSWNAPGIAAAPGAGRMNRDLDGVFGSSCSSSQSCSSSIISVVVLRLAPRRSTLIGFIRAFEASDRFLLIFAAVTPAFESRLFSTSSRASASMRLSSTFSVFSRWMLFLRF